MKTLPATVIGIAGIVVSLLIGMRFNRLVDREKQRRRRSIASVAAVLLVVGLGLPIVYIGSFVSQVNMQIVRYGLKAPKAVYTVRLNYDGIHVVNDQKAEGQLDVKWSEAQAAFRAKKCVYLYVNAARAFLLPDGQADAEPEELWAYIEKHMPGKARRL